MPWFDVMCLSNHTLAYCDVLQCSVIFDSGYLLAKYLIFLFLFWLLIYDYMIFFISRVSFYACVVSGCINNILKCCWKINPMERVLVSICGSANTSTSDQTFFGVRFWKCINSWPLKKVRSRMNLCLTIYGRYVQTVVTYTQHNKI